MDIRINKEMYYLPTGLNFSLRNGKYCFSCLRSNARAITEALAILPCKLVEQGDMFVWELTVEVTEFTIFG